MFNTDSFHVDASTCIDVLQFPIEPGVDFGARRRIAAHRRQALVTIRSARQLRGQSIGGESPTTTELEWLILPTGNVLPWRFLRCAQNVFGLSF
jgi:hypothetical protein